MNSLKIYLSGIAALLVLLTGAAAFVVAYQVDAFAQAQNERQSVDTARALSLVVDAKLQGYRGLLSALQTSRAVRESDWRAVDMRARDTLREPDAWIVVADRTGRQLVNTRLPPGAALPSGPSPDIWVELDLARDRICNLGRGYVEPEILCVDAPILRNGGAVQSISVIFRPAIFDALLSREMLRQGHFVTIVDRNGVVIWRNISADRFIGKLATPDLRAAIAQRPEGVMRSVSLDNVPTLVAYSRGRISGWTFVVAVPQNEIAAPRERAVILGLGVAAGLLSLAVLLGLWAGGRLARAIGRLNAAATRLGAVNPPAYRPTGLREIDAVGDALGTALAERDASLERLRLAQEVGGIGSWEWDVPNDRGQVSDAYREMHGLPAAVGPVRLAQVLAVIHPDDVAGYKTGLAAALRTATPSVNDYRVVRPDGSIRWIYAKGRPTFGPDGAVVSAIGVVIDLTERRETEERLRLLMGEVDHRANNLLSVVQSAVTLSRASDDGQLKEIILGRIGALAHAHKLLAASQWAGADLRRLIEIETDPYKLGDEGKVELDGTAVPVSPAAAQGLALALHELATNAAKYGALSTPDGRVHVRWRAQDGRMNLRWTEIGGPRVQPPTRQGFGTTVIQRALQGSIGGTSRIEWRAEGLVCVLEFPLRDGSA